MHLAFPIFRLRANLEPGRQLRNRRRGIPRGFVCTFNLARPGFALQAYDCFRCRFK